MRFRVDAQLRARAHGGLAQQSQEAARSVSPRPPGEDVEEATDDAEGIEGAA
jgi:hypothetical protein